MKDDLSGRTCVVTGASAGIGKEIARGLALRRARVVLACRSEERGRAAAEDIAADTCNDRVESMTVDVSSRASVRAFADAFARTHDALHVLVNNAGVWLDRKAKSADGIELTWATNVLGYHLVTALLLDVLRRSAPARIVNVASGLARGLDLEDVEFERRRWDGVAAYAQSKQADRMLTWRLATRLEGTGVVANAMHPGGVRTDLFRREGGVRGPVVRLGIRLFGRTPERGADTAVWLASSEEMGSSSGQFWMDRKARRCRFRDEREIERLVDLCDRTCGISG